ncbi:MAG: hypothetical protein ACPG4T_10935 [Nannocystaceae bacterium]
MDRPVSYGPSVADWCACHIPGGVRVGAGCGPGGGRGFDGAALSRMLHRRGWVDHIGTNFDVWFAVVIFGSQLPLHHPVHRGGRVIELTHLAARSYLHPRQRARLLAAPWRRAKLWLDHGYGELEQWFPVDRPQVLVTVATRFR